MRTNVTILTLIFVCGAAKAAPAASDQPGFGTAVRPFLQQHCTKCHGEKKQKGRLRLDGLGGSLASETDREIWRRVAEKLWLGEMPPEDEPQPGPHHTGRVLGWLSTAFAQAGHKLTPPAAMELPGGGNRVSHEALFAANAGAGAPLASIPPPKKLPQ